MVTPPLFPLEGDALDLSRLEELIRTGDRRIFSQEGRHYLSLQLRDDIGDEDALERAKEELATISGIAFLLVGDHRPLRVAGISRIDAATGKIQTTVYGRAAVTIPPPRMRAIGVVVNPDGRIEKPSDSRQSGGEEVLEMAAQNEPLQRALYLYGKLDHNWHGLYMILEAIKDGNGGWSGLVAKSWAGPPVEHFKATANSYKALGTDARHGTTANGVDNPQMTLTAAKDLLRHMLLGWIRELIGKRVI